MKALIIILAVLSTGCAGSMNTKLPPHPQEQITVHATNESFCRAYNGQKTCRPGAFIYYPTKAIHLRPEWTTCQLNHERAHAWGWRHEGVNKTNCRGDSRCSTFARANKGNHGGCGPTSLEAI